MAPPASSARALHDLLADVNGRIKHGHKTGQHAWVDVAGSPVGSMEFIDFHTEAVTLMREVLDALDNMPAASRDRFSRYVPAWWDALIQPGRGWGADYATLIDQSTLDHLGSLADVMEALGGPTNPQAVEILRRGVDRLLVDVKAADDIVPNVRAQIVADLEHIAGLLSQVETFGVQHAAAEVQKLTGRVVAEAVKAPTGGLTRVALQLSVVLALLAPVTTDVETIVGNLRSVFGIEAAASPGQDVVQSTVVEIYEACTPKALPPGSNASFKELPAGSSDDEPVDAEVIEDGDN